MKLRPLFVSAIALSACLAVPALAQDRVDANGLPTTRSTPSEQAATAALNDSVSTSNAQADAQSAAQQQQYQQQLQQNQAAVQQNQAAQQVASNMAQMKDMSQATSRGIELVSQSSQNLVLTSQDLLAQVTALTGRRAG